MPPHAPPLVRRQALPGRTPTDHGLTPATIGWVAGLHIFAIVLISLGTWLHRPPPQEQFIEMVSLGELDPGAGDTLENASTDPGPPQPTPPSHAPAPPQPVTPPAPTPTPIAPRIETPPPPPKPAPTPQPQAQAITPKPLPKPAPKPTTPVKVNLTPVKRAEGVASNSTTPPKYTKPGGAGSGKGLSAAEIKARLAGKVGTTGIADGTGSGKPGDPNGDPNADPYNALIKITLERAWNKPSIPEALETHVKIRVKPDGRIQFEGLAKPSGNLEMDNTVIEAVHKVPRMPQPPPAGLGNPDYIVTINFKLN